MSLEKKRVIIFPFFKSNFLLVEAISKFKAWKEEWIKQDSALWFSSKIELSEKERKADEKFDWLWNEVVHRDFNPTIHDFYENMVYSIILEQNQREQAF